MKTNYYMDSLRREERRFYVDPVDLWFERNPVLGAIALGAIVFTLIFLGCLL